MPNAGVAPAPEAIVAFVSRLLSGQSIDLAGCPIPLEFAVELGVERDQARLVLPAGWDPLREGSIRSALSGRAGAWLRRLEVWPAIGSTSAMLVERAEHESVGGHVCMAEVQFAGRGRRGRSWLSPLGGNLAITLGFEARRPAHELGGFSLVVGLGVLDALDSIGIPDLALKWPNDVLLAGAKLGGILIDLVQGPSGLALIVGVGLNVRLPAWVRAQLEQPVADLASVVSALPIRSELAARLISGIVDFEHQFTEEGFAPFARAFDSRHTYQDREVTILQGAGTLHGRVLGVAVDGGLRVLTSNGEQVVHGGEVSLRPQAPGPA
jgi:BirA family biotin operon repressor/biotin-[acetyl-CoA-carboxylase] ligase